jgi:hypothetical protein
MPKWKSLVWNNKVITNLEHSCQELKEQHVAYIEFDREKQSLIAQIQD